MFSGSIVAMVTPFLGGRVDPGALRRHVEWLLANGTRGLVPCGTTGESPVLTEEEWELVVRTTIETVRKRVPVIPGTGTNSTAKTVKLTHRAEELGADGALVVTPYYNKPTQRGLEEHYRAVAGETKLPVIIYNIPGRTGVNILPETVAKLAQLKNIVGIKEATGSIDQSSWVLKLCGPDFCLLSGEDSLNFPIMAIGGKGAISATANVIPKETAELMAACEAGDWPRARELHLRLLPLNRDLFMETNPGPVKLALGFMGRMSSEVRPPLAPLSPENQEKLKLRLKEYGLI